MPVRLTSSSGRNQYPKWSPDGSTIAFASTRDGNFEIYVMNADGSGQTRLTTSATPDYDPAFSPDGTLLAWSARDAGGANQIFTMSSSGGPATQLTSGEGAFQPDWQALAPEPAPDGSTPPDPSELTPEFVVRPLRIGGDAARLTRRGMVLLRLRCLLDDGRCRGTFKLTAPRRKRAAASQRSRRRRTVIGRKSFSVEAGKGTLLKVRLSRNGRRRVLNRRQMRCTASAVLRGSDGRTQTVRSNVVLKVPAALRRAQTTG